MKLSRLIEKRIDDIKGVKKSIIKDRGYEVAAFFDLDGTLHFNDAQWKVIPEKAEMLNGFLPLTAKERKTLRVSQERGAHFAEVLRKNGYPDITKFFDMSEFGARAEYIKQTQTGKPVENIIKLLQKHIAHGHRVYILTARSGKRQDLAQTFGSKIDEIVGGATFNLKGAVYTINDPQFKPFWSALNINSSAARKAAIIQSFLKYKEGHEPFEDNPKKELFLNWRREHEDRLVDVAYFYDDEMPNITAVENMADKESDKLLHGKNAVVVHFVQEERPKLAIESLKQSEVEMKLAGITKHEIIKRLNEEDERVSLLVANEQLTNGEIILKRKAIIDMYRDLSKDNFERKLNNKFKFEIVQMAKAFELPQTNNREGLTEMIYDKIKELNEMAKTGEAIQLSNGKALTITKGNRGRGTEVEAGGKTYKLKSNAPIGKYNGVNLYSAEETAPKAEKAPVGEKKLDKREKKSSVAIPAKFRPGAFVSAFTSALKNHTTTGVSEKGKEDSFSVQGAEDFIKRFKDGLSKQQNLKFKDALTKLADVAEAITKIHAGSASEADCKKLDGYVAGVKLKSGKEMSFSTYLKMLKSKNKMDVFHTKVKERLQKVIDKKTAAIEKSLGDARGEKAVEEELVYLNSSATRLYDKIMEASMYQNGVKMFVEGVIENTPEEGKDALHENLKTAFKALALNRPAYAEVLD